MDICDEDGKFFMVANAQSQAGFPVCFLTSPPTAVYDEKMAEQEAVKQALITGKRHFILEAIAFVEIKDGAPVWNDAVPK
jgi:hypothetical protein